MIIFSNKFSNLTIIDVQNHNQNINQIVKSQDCKHQSNKLNLASLNIQSKDWLLDEKQLTMEIIAISDGIKESEGVRYLMNLTI